MHFETKEFVPYILMKKVIFFPNVLSIENDLNISSQVNKMF